ncbi:ABC transporter substrate-binding protein [Tengunoibacter tsumagoiensis]|uniref:ABC transporter substrate-binding protein n=1 Tax=Tengunoibacter tsumagoiensis TaxID=2014871 RepID=A0A402A0K6_9CHLR|nr:ABC transporter substrate-binding protein [Tengunoibacter tsumagoiensis]GCE12592.1 ABC transporter substrate-binding protein [Tengunoibacter tsumagoiensis]
MHTSTRTVRRLPALYFLVAALFSLILAACGSDNSSTGSTPSTVATIAPPTTLLQSGQLLVGSDTTYTPMEYLDAKTNNFAGFDVDLAAALAQRMGIKSTIQKTSFDTIFDDLNNKRFDIVMSSVTVNDKRSKKFDFVPYFSAGESLLVKTGNPKNLKSTADLCGLNVGVQTGTVEQQDLDAASKDCQQKGKGEIKQTILDDQTAVIDLLATGRVDATYQDSPVTDYYNKINPGRFVVGGSVVNSAPYGITIRKGDTAMLDAVKAAFKSLKDDGSYDKLFTKWGFTPSQKI